MAAPKPFLTVPRQALAELLLASGSTLTPEEFVASLPEVDATKRFPGRARAAAWSQSILAVVAVLALLCLPFDLSIENVIVVIGLAVVTYFEFRVHRYFINGDQRAPDLGFRNQSCFAAGILIYGLYHAVLHNQIQIPAEYREVMDPSMPPLIQALTRIFYLIIGTVGGISQFALACYYRAARVKPVNVPPPPRP